MSTPQSDAFGHALQDVWEQHHGNNDGEVANYIPELSYANPDHFGLAIATVDGRVRSHGDVEVPFTIQSISKAFAFAIAIETVGLENISLRVGLEPSADPFNAILFDRDNRPFNPMVNAGAIGVSSLLLDAHGNDTFDLVLERLSLAAGRRLSVNEAVYRSESLTGERNRAIAHLLKANDRLLGDPNQVLDFYFRQCAIEVTALDLARIGATAANMGQNPVTGEPAFDVAAVRAMLSVMLTCGMYDYAGSWAFKVGIPAKSGVGGGILGVVNRQIGIASFSPRLDRWGNSLRGAAAFTTLSEEFGLHAFDCTNVGSSYLTSMME